MSEIAQPSTCPKCGGPISPEAPKGLCPRCLLRQASVPTEQGTVVTAPFPVPTQEQLARAFPELEILELVGRGGMGFVFKARQPKLDRFVALKILPQSLAGDPAFAARFEREARMLARLNHPNIVTIHDFGRANGFFYLLLEFVDGVNLRQALRLGGFTPGQALAIVPRICDALQFAHGEGILHRDIKPENILLDSKGRVKIADFGIAKLVFAKANGADAAAPVKGNQSKPTTILEPALTETGKIFGTPNYIAPEQVEHPDHVDQRADIYSLGVVFYEMLTGELPLGHFAPPSATPAVDPRLDKVVLHALEKNPERRTPSAGVLKTEVETIAGVPVHATTAKRKLSRTTVLASAAVLLILLAVSVLGPRFLTGHSPIAAPNPVQGPREVIISTIRNEVGRQLRETGASYDELLVSIAIDRDSAPPFKVTYRGLQNFKTAEGALLAGNGEFLMEWIGAGQWQGRLGGRPFTVVVASRDNINLPFVDDPALIGDWQAVDFVRSPAEFCPGQRQFEGQLFLRNLRFLAGGITSEPWLKWTKGSIMHAGDQTSAHYEIREVGGQRYLFFEWKSGDVTIAGRKPYFYVLQKTR